MSVEREKYYDVLEGEACERLRKGEDRETIKRDMSNRLVQQFPDYFAPTKQDGKVSGISFAQIIVSRAKNELGRYYQQQPAAPAPQVHITVISDSTINVVSEPQSKPRTNTKRKLNYRLVADDALSLQDRIIFSLAWKWDYISQSKKTELPVTVERFRRATGFRPSTIRKSITALIARGYLSASLTPLKHHAVIGYRKLAWTKSGNGIAHDIFAAMVATNTKFTNAMWFVKTLGISRRTYYRMKKAT